MYIENSVIMEMVSELNDFNGCCEYYISPLDANGRTQIEYSNYSGNYIVLKGSTIPRNMEDGDIDIALSLNDRCNDIIGIGTLEEMLAIEHEVEFDDAICNIEPWDGVLADSPEITMEQILAATTVRIYYSYQNTQQLETALRELLSNGNLKFEEIGAHRYQFTDDVIGHEEKFTEYDEDPDDYRPRISNDPDLRMQIVMPGDKPDGTWWQIIHKWHVADAGDTNWGGFIQITFDPNMYGYWTRPGTLIFRALGQGLKVEIPKA